MPKGGMNRHAAAASERKEATKSAAKASAAKQKGDAAWADSTNDARDAKAQAKAAERDAKAARKAEDRAAASAEDAEMAAVEKKKNEKRRKGKGAAKPEGTLTAFQRQAVEDKRKADEKKARKAAAKGLGLTVVDDAALEAPDNRGAAGTPRKSGVDGALAELGAATAVLEAQAAGLGLEGTAAGNAAAEGRMTYALYEARELPELKEDKPDLKTSQYRDMIRKQWKKSAENPGYQGR